MMKRRNRLILITVLVAVLLLVLLHGCQSGTTPVSVPEKTEAPLTEPTSDTSAGAETTEAAATGCTETIENTESTPATEAPTEAPTEATEAETEPETPNNPKPADPKPANPTPTPTEPKPAEPKPTEPKPTEPKPTEPKPTEPKPTEPKPTEPAPTEPKPTSPVHTHSWSAWNQSKAPTSTANGEEVRTCNCGAKETRPVNALGHNWSGWSQTKAPTCGAEGAEARRCSRCGVSESRSVPATGNHSWNETAPTCTEAGSKTCKVCGKSESGSAALGHDWVHHDEEGHWRDHITCYCGQVFYSYEDWNAHANASTDLDYLDAHAGYSDYNEWIVDKPAYDSCSRCGATR